MQSLGKKSPDSAGTSGLHEPVASASGALVLPRFIRRPFRSLSGLSPLKLLRSKRVLTVVTLLIALPAAGYWASNNDTAKSYLSTTATALGFRINNLVVRGGPNVDREALKFLLSAELEKSIFAFDAANARNLLKHNSRIQSATVRKVYPDTVSIDIIEREPFAIWKSGGEMKLIASDGTVVVDINDTPPQLPQVVGEGAELAAGEFLTVMASYPMLASRVQAYVRVGKRRWNLVLRDGTKVLLPENEWEPSIAELYDLQTHQEILDRELVQIDMRLTDRLVFRLKSGQGEIRRSYIEKLIKNEGQST